MKGLIQWLSTVIIITYYFYINTSVNVNTEYAKRSISNDQLASMKSHS